MNVALIDDGVNINHYTREYIISFLELNESLTEFVEQTSYVDPASHGSICAGIIRNFSDRVNLISLKILDENLCASVGKLIKAFEWCQENYIDIINLSLGTTNCKDFIEIQRCIKHLASKGVIVVAALNNDDTYTIPASMPEVVGGCTHHSEDIKVIENSIIGVNVAACSNHWIQLDHDRRIHTPYCNSFAAPAVTGGICQLLSGGESGSEVLSNRFLEKIAQNIRISAASISDESMVKLNFTPQTFQNLTDVKLTKKVPLIGISCRDKDLKAFNQLFYNDNLFPLALGGDTAIDNLTKKQLHRLVQRIGGIFDCDLIFLHHLQMRTGREDIIMRVSGSDVCLAYKKRFQKREVTLRSFEEAYQAILNLLA
ncbi:S8 family serine peptidase [Paenibacillus macerans]|uniref:S8 family serine peptidase n=1 Tax=Paenibacillus macerans TaxID=44252 RepID=UPI0022E59C4C|nr:S8 family serine peptidase [Paenibacillus macerans]MEC0137845.1 S8 family serine peptidase [Paenibacillus macerans]